ncbi:MAG TPA: peptidase U34 [Firmicutes bacterium]|nr:peptidase U34 [Bacillota bacterium]
MCDTLVALGSATRNGDVIFAKNSDRQPNEPHLMIHVPRKTYPKGSKLRCTYVEIDQARETYEVLLLKPSWLWGAEMGANEFGLNIGNEAVFTKVKQGPPALLGMDLLRLALERCQTSKEALHLITELLARYGQGGNCGYEKKFVYHNSFLLADKNSAYVLETAGPYWVAKEVKDIYCISNRLTLGNDFDFAHPKVIDYATGRGWCRSRDDFHFARCFSNRLYSRASGAAQRRRACLNGLEREKGDITVETMFKILRSHSEKIKDRPFQKASLTSVCMHGGFLIGDHCTGSYAASLGENLQTYWLTGSSTPCISVFKPYWFSQKEYVFRESEEKEALAFWLEREKLHRLILENRVLNLEEYRRKAKEIEGAALAAVSALNDQPSETKLKEIMAKAWAKEQELVKSTIEKNKANPPKIKGSPIFRAYWRRQTKKLGF